MRSRRRLQIRLLVAEIDGSRRLGSTGCCEVLLTPVNAARRGRVKNTEFDGEKFSVDLDRFDFTVNNKAAWWRVVTDQQSYFENVYGTTEGISGCSAKRG